LEDYRVRRRLLRLRKRPLQTGAVVTAGVVAFVISVAVPAGDVPAAYYSAVSAVIPLLLIALFTAFGRHRADIVDLRRDVNRVIAEKPPGAERLKRTLKPIHAARVRITERFIGATIIATIGEAAALVGIASHSTMPLLVVTILTMLGLVIVLVAAEVSDLAAIPSADHADADEDLAKTAAQQRAP
jgi:hypothetical protein